MYVTCFFSLVAFNILSLSLIFVCLINMYLIMFLTGFILYGTLCFLDLSECFPSHVREVLSYYVFKYFLTSFLSFPSGTPINVCVFNSFPEVSETDLISFHFFFFILFHSCDFHHSVFQSLIRSSASVILLLIPSSVFFIPVIVLLISVCSLNLLAFC